MVSSILLKFFLFTKDFIVSLFQTFQIVNILLCDSAFLISQWTRRWLLLNHNHDNILRIWSWVACFLVSLVTQSCRKMKCSSRHGWLIIVCIIFDGHGDYRYLLHARLITLYCLFYLLVQYRFSCITSIMLLWKHCVSE